MLQITYYILHNQRGPAATSQKKRAVSTYIGRLHSDDFCQTGLRVSVCVDGYTTIGFALRSTAEGFMSDAALTIY